MGHEAWTKGAGDTKTILADHSVCYGIGRKQHNLETQNSPSRQQTSPQTRCSRQQSTTHREIDRKLKRGHIFVLKPEHSVGEPWACAREIRRFPSPLVANYRWPCGTHAKACEAPGHLFHDLRGQTISDRAYGGWVDRIGTSLAGIFCALGSGAVCAPLLTLSRPTSSDDLPSGSVLPYTQPKPIKLPQLVL